MNRRESESPPTFRVAWPVEALVSVAAEPRHRTAIIVVVNNAEEVSQRLLTTGLAVNLALNGVELFALVGRESEEAHDALDCALEVAGAEGVVTSWHDPDDPEDVTSFVLSSCRASGLNLVVAALDESTKSGARLRSSIDKALRAYADE